MKAAILIAISVFLATSALAEGSCERWSYAKLEDEGGPAPAAFICPVGDPGSLIVHCAQGGNLYVSFFEAQGAPDRQPDFSARYTITIGDDTFRRKAIFQAMDASMALDPQRRSGPLVAAILNGESMTISPEAPETGGGDVPLKLTGSSAALTRLLQNCE